MPPFLVPLSADASRQKRRMTSPEVTNPALSSSYPIPSIRFRQREHSPSVCGAIHPSDYHTTDSTRKLSNGALGRIPA